MTIDDGCIDQRCRVGHSVESVRASNRAGHRNSQPGVLVVLLLAPGVLVSGVRDFMTDDGG